MRRLRTTLLAAAVLAGSFGAAEAHPRLLAATPSAGARIAAPAEVRLSFSETLIGRFSQITIADARGQPVPTGPSTVTVDRRQLTTTLRNHLAPGTYRVSWRAVSTDTHRVQGAYAFVVTR